VVLGTPSDAEQVRYQRGTAADFYVPVADELPSTISLALERIGGGADRSSGQREVPLLLWRLPAFANWLSAQEAAGNELRGARVEWTFRVGPTKTIVLFFALHVTVWVRQEQRLKSNEVVISRPDVATVVAYLPADTLERTEVILVKEFRSPASTVDGYVRELPGGSSFKPDADPLRQAVDELLEETGLDITPDRLRYHGSRQPNATVTAHQQHVHSVALTHDEMATIRADHAAYGVADDSERTYPEVWTMEQLLSGDLVDWTTLGILSQVLRVTP
jgi:8-oxo-dGTP pyrophosphatase MutT (NUDIX family)